MKEYEIETNREYKYSAMSMNDFEFAKKKRDPLIMNVIESEFVVIFVQCARCFEQFFLVRLELQHAGQRFWD